MSKRILIAGPLVAATLIVVAAAMASSAPPESRSVTLATLNGSRVTGTVTLTDIGQGRTRIDVRVDPAGNMDMPAHVHPGTCDTLVPQPRYPLRNVVNGVSITDVIGVASTSASASFARTASSSSTVATGPMRTRYQVSSSSAKRISLAVSDSPSTITTRSAIVPSQS